MKYQKQPIRIAAAFILFVLLVATFLPLSAQTTVRRVTTAGDSAADGSTWAAAMTLKAALAASDSLDQVWTAAGTYKPDATNQNATFTIPAGVLVYGGFEGDEITFTPDDPLTPENEDTRDRNAEDALMHVTILSGDLADNDLTDREDANYALRRTENSYSVVTVGGANVTLNGLTIEGGERGTDVIDLDLFRTEYNGAGLYAGAGTTGVTLKACTFNNNNADEDGGGAYFTEGATLTDCTFNNNSADDDGGGAYFTESATLTDCTFNNNSADDDGGGAYFDGAATLTDCIFNDNNSDYWGGGAYFSGTATVTNCTFTENTANGGSSEGGGAFFGGTATVTNCTFTDNETTDNGGGAYFGGVSTVINSTLYNNNADSRGGGLYVNNLGFPFILQNSILIGNTAADAARGHQIRVFNTDTADIVNIQNNLIAGGADPLGTDQGVAYGTSGSANITEANTMDESDATVVFASIMAENANYLRLVAGSPAVNAGNNDYLNNGTPDDTDDDIKTDLAGEMRIQGGTVDLGAYEGGIAAPTRLNIRRVTTTGAGTGDGSSWVQAMTLQAALAASTTTGDQVWIAAGTYKPHADDRAATFTIPAGVLVYGGFEGDENTFMPDDPLTPENEDTRDRNAEGALMHVTILSGDLADNDLTDREDANYALRRTENSYTVVTVSGANVTLNGLTIEGGERGTAVINFGTRTSHGAGLYAGVGTTGTTLTACTFNNNSADDGGGAYFTEGVTLTDCTFNNNNADDDGGGAYFTEGATLTDCTFNNNNADDDGGGAYFDGAATLTGCNFNDNNSDYWGGGAYFSGTATVTNCTFTENTANGVPSHGGGALFRGTTTVTQCTFTDNETTNNGGGAYFDGVSTVINSTLYNNNADDKGGGLYVTSSAFPFILQNSILLGNTAADAARGHQIRVFNTDAADIVNIQNNLIAGGADPLGTDQGITYGTSDSANITEANTMDESDATVVFASIMAENANYLRLVAGSPAVNAGNNDYLNNGTPDDTDDDIKTDLAGEMRIQGGTVDLGAYEGGIDAPTGLNIRRVTTTGTGDGSSWVQAMTLQAALAASTTTGNQIWIAEGTYKPHADDRAATFTIPAGVLVYGGFDPVADATDTDASSRSGAATILSGDLLGDDIALRRDSRDDNSYSVVTVGGANVTLDGLTIEGGERGTDVVDLDLFRTEYNGAGLYAGAGTTGVTLKACTFNNNNADEDGGGAYFTEGATLTDCTFNNNNADDDGGGAYFTEGATLTDCTFNNNNADDDGGGAYFYGAATLTGCNFNDNNSDYWGGGAYFSGTATVTNCTFTENTANGVPSHGGGALFRGTTTVTQCTFTDNETTNNGGGAYFDGVSTVINSTLYNNNADDKGGGLYVTSHGFPFTLQNSILLGNTAADAASGHQVYVNNTNTTHVVNIQNNLIAGGADPLGTDQGVVYRTSGSANVTEAGTVDESKASVVFASTDASATVAFLRLATGSPAINAGNNSYIPAGITTDAAGNARIQDGTVDLGAYEGISSVDAGTGTALGIEDAVDDFVLYPNPTSDKLHFSEQVGEFRLYSVEGRLLETWKNVRSVDLTKMPSGLYFTEVIRDGRSVHYRIMRK